MATARLSSKKAPEKPKARPKALSCECGETRPTHFPDLKATVCSSCARKAAQREDPGSSNSPLGPLPPKDEAVKVDAAAQGELFSSTSIEIDPSNPSHQELAARTAASRALLPFIQRFRPKYQAGWVHKDICRRLERFVNQVEEKKEPRLLLCMPVRHGKSEIGSRHFAPWVLGKHPDWEIIAASGAQSLALTFSRYIRDLMLDQNYHSVSPARLDPKSQSVENWNTTAGGGYLAAGVGTMITGRGSHILLIDDAVKDAEAADSQTIRDNIWEWYISTALSRLAPGGGVLVIMTLWNEDDLGGRLQQLANFEGADKFEVVKYPAINDQGDEYILEDDSIVQIPSPTPPPPGAKLTRPMGTALHPERYTVESLLRRKATYYAQGQQRWWSALYQQNPSPEDGAYFTKEMFRFYVNPPYKLERNVYQGWDFAITETQQGDYIVGSCAEQDHKDNLFFTDIMRFKASDSFLIVDSILDFWVLHGSEALIGVEDGQIWKSIEAVFKRRCEERRLYPSYEVLKPYTDKFVRAQPLRGRMQQGKVWFPEKAPWFDVLRKEFLSFGGGGKHDDQVDSCSWAARLALNHAAPRLPEPKPHASWRDKLAATFRGRGATHMAA